MKLCAMVWLAGQNPVSNYWHKLTDKTFSGVYHANAFDLAMMIPYFIVLVILAVYGLHRYWLVYDYYKYRKNVPGPPPLASHWPRVTVQLPIYNERYVTERLVEAVSKFDYPAEVLDVQVLDDSTDETQQVARACVERHAAAGMPISYIHRSNRAGFKAGALENGLKTARGEFIAMFDADFIPEADFLRRTIPYFQNPEIGMVQTRWTCWTGILWWSTGRGPGAGLFLILTAPPACGGGQRSMAPEDGSTTRSPKTPIFPIARS